MFINQSGVLSRLSLPPLLLCLQASRDPRAHLSVRSKNKVFDFIFGVYKLFREHPSTFISDGAWLFSRCRTLSI